MPKKPAKPLKLPSYAKLLELITTQQEQLRAQEELIETQNQIIALIGHQFPEVRLWVQDNVPEFPLFDQPPNPE